MCVPYLGWDSTTDQLQLSKVLLHHLMTLTGDITSVENRVVSQLKPLNSRFYCLGKYHMAHYEQKLYRLIKCYKQTDSWTEEQKNDAIEMRTIACEREKRWVLEDAYEWIALFQSLIKHFGKVYFFYLDSEFNAKKVFYSEKQTIPRHRLCPDTLFYLQPETLLEVQGD